MALLVLCDAKYYRSVWCMKKLCGIYDEAAKRRISAPLYTDLSAFEKDAGQYESGSAVICLFDSVIWMEKAAKIIEQTGLHPILSTYMCNLLPPRGASIVASNADDAMYTAVDYLHGCGKRRIALVGINRDSWNDTGRANTLKQYTTEDARGLFYIDDSMENCFAAFYAQHTRYDAVICSNDHIAIHLCEWFRRRGEKPPFLLSYTDTITARLYAGGITSMSVNFYEVGRTAVAAYFDRIRHRAESVCIFLKSELHIRGSTDNQPYIHVGVSLQKAAENAEHPGKITFPLFQRKLSKLEHLLNTSDATNLKLIYGLLLNRSYEEMGEFCFLTPEAARYRVRKMKDMLGCKNRSEAAAFLADYISVRNLGRMISEIEDSVSHTKFSKRAADAGLSKKTEKQSKSPASDL